MLTRGSREPGETAPVTHFRGGQTPRLLGLLGATLSLLTLVDLLADGRDWLFGPIVVSHVMAQGPSNRTANVLKSSVSGRTLLGWLRLAGVA